jgi:two-component system, cell cycle response regulator DivK
MSIRKTSGKWRVSIVEDNRLVAEFFKLALEGSGDFSCVISEDVLAIVSEIEAGNVDLVLLDVSLKNSEWEGHAVSGVKLCRIFKKKSSRRLPVLLATGLVASEGESLLGLSGADGYLEKPVFDSALLIAKVRELLT